jgi:hypothetical protein
MFTIFFEAGDLVVKILNNIFLLTIFYFLEMGLPYKKYPTPFFCKRRGSIKMITIFLRLRLLYKNVQQ